MKPPRSTLALAAALTGLVVGPGALEQGDAGDVPLGLPHAALARAAPDGELVALGERLFFDPRLSADRSISCGSCHRPEHGFADNVPRSRGVGGRLTTHNTPTILNRALGEVFMWDGRAGSLEEQVLLPIQNELEMNLALDAAVERLSEEDGYRPAFEAVLGGPPSAERLSSALAAFVRSRLTGGAPVDRFRAGERDALSAEERAGLWIFESTGSCWRCHSGPNFTDEAFHNTGIGAGRVPEDSGRLAVTGAEEDRGRFKTPTLRALAHTAPYMHDGSLGTLEEVVAFYREGGRPNPNLDPRLRPLDLSDTEAANLVAFLRALTTR